MATTTPLFGWSVPTSSDLVKNGATAIETLGDSIDASMGELLGGTTGQVLSKTSNTSMDFTWITPSAGGGGKVLQVVYATTTTDTTIASTSFATTTLTATITPTLNTSKVMILCSSMSGGSRATIFNGTQMRLVRGATAIFTNNNFWHRVDGASALQYSFPVAVNYLDSPATTSATTYTLQGAGKYTTDSGCAQFQYDNAPSTIMLLEIGA